MCIEEAMTEAQRIDAERKAAGFIQESLDDAARRGFGNGAFEDSEDESSAVAEEFFSESSSNTSDILSANQEEDRAAAAMPTLIDKLDRKLAATEEQPC